MTGRLSRRGSPPPSCGGRDASQRLVHDEIGTWEERALFYQMLTFMCIIAHADSSRKSLGYPGNDNADIVSSPATQRRLHEHIACARWIDAIIQYALNLRVTHHLPETIRTEEQLVFRLKLDDKPVYLHLALTAQAAIHFIALRMGIH